MTLSEKNFFCFIYLFLFRIKLNSYFFYRIFIEYNHREYTFTLSWIKKMLIDWASHLCLRESQESRIYWSDAIHWKSQILVHNTIMCYYKLHASSVSFDMWTESMNENICLATCLIYWQVLFVKTYIICTYNNNNQMVLLLWDNSSGVRSICLIHIHSWPKRFE